MQDITPADATPADITLQHIQHLEVALKELADQYDIESLTTHHFADKAYMRMLQIPAGAAIVGKRHATENFFLLVSGTMALCSPGERPEIIKAPFMSVVKPGDKRAAVAINDCVCMNFHPNPDNERDLAVLEQRYVMHEALDRPAREEIAWPGQQ